MQMKPTRDGSTTPVSVVRASHHIFCEKVCMHFHEGIAKSSRRSFHNSVLQSPQSLLLLTHMNELQVRFHVLFVQYARQTFMQQRLKHDRDLQTFLVVTAIEHFCCSIRIHFGMGACVHTGCRMLSARPSKVHRTCLEENSAAFLPP